MEPRFGLRSGFEGLGSNMWEGLEIDWGDRVQGPMGGHDLGKGPGMVDTGGGRVVQVTEESLWRG